MPCCQLSLFGTPFFSPLRTIIKSCALSSKGDTNKTIVTNIPVLCLQNLVPDVFSKPPPGMESKKGNPRGLTVFLSSLLDGTGGRII